MVEFNPLAIFIGAIFGWIIGESCSSTKEFVLWFIIFVFILTICELIVLIEE